MALTKLGILISGRGSNMQSIVRACSAGAIPADVAVVISNRDDAAGLQWASDHDIPTAVLSHKDYDTRADHDGAIIKRLADAGVEWVCLAGYMRLLSQAFIDAYPMRILNIHPSILPSFPGLHGQRDAFEYGVAVSGCTVHIVDLELDHGPIVVQRVVQVEGCSNPEELAARILDQEHRAYPEALARLLGESWSIQGRRVVSHR